MRKSPVRHRVKSHTRKGKRIQSFERGKGNKPQRPSRVVRKPDKETSPDAVTEEFYREMKEKFPMVRKAKEWELYDDGAGGMVFNTKTMEGWCIGEEGIHEGRLPPPTAWHLLDLEYSTKRGVPEVVWL